ALSSCKTRVCPRKDGFAVLEWGYLDESCETSSGLLSGKATDTSALVLLSSGLPHLYQKGMVIKMKESIKIGAGIILTAILLFAPISQISPNTSANDGGDEPETSAPTEITTEPTTTTPTATTTPPTTTTQRTTTTPPTTTTPRTTRQPPQIATTPPTTIPVVTTTPPLITMPEPDITTPGITIPEQTTEATTETTTDVTTTADNTGDDGIITPPTVNITTPVFDYDDYPYDEDNGDNGDDESENTQDEYDDESAGAGTTGSSGSGGIGGIIAASIFVLCGGGAAPFVVKELKLRKIYTY
ncbi:MAG: hypothetical protein FWF76_00650, partial [Oscillospiraceae bacterium]|nr:hypothetical protein [Oscillospiraceae bacterium]